MSELVGEEISVFPEDITVSLLKKSIAIIAAHVGFEGKSELRCPMCNSDSY
jgi:hypothetical protein